MTTAAVIQARHSSTRLPGKMIAPLAGRPVIRHLTDRMQRANGIDVVAVAIPEGEAEAPLAEAVRAIPEVLLVEGPLDDVTRRFALAMAATGADLIVRVFGDGPVVDPAAVTRLLACHAANTAPCTILGIDSGFPIGNECQAIDAWALDAADHQATAFEDREDITPYFRRHPNQFPIAACYRGDAPRHSPIELLLDTAGDLARLERVSGALIAEDPCFGADAVERLFAERPALFA